MPLTPEDVEKKSGRSKYTASASPLKDQMVQEVFKKASDQYDAKQYNEAAANFYLTYQLSPIDTTLVFNAAVSASLAKDYDTALKHYKQLQDLGYTGIQTSILLPVKRQVLKKI